MAGTSAETRGRSIFQFGGGLCSKLSQVSLRTDRCSNSSAACSPGSFLCLPKTVLPSPYNFCQWRDVPLDSSLAAYWMLLLIDQGHVWRATVLREQRSARFGFRKRLHARQQQPRLFTPLFPTAMLLCAVRSSVEPKGVTQCHHSGEMQSGPVALFMPGTSIIPDRRHTGLTTLCNSPKRLSRQATPKHVPQVQKNAILNFREDQDVRLRSSQRQSEELTND